MGLDHARACLDACKLLGVTFPKAPGLPRAEQQRVLQEWKDGPLKRAWRDLAKKSHPDGVVGGDAEEQAKRTADFKKAREAYELLLSVQFAEERVQFGPFELDEEDVALANEILGAFEKRFTAAADDLARETRTSIRRGAVGFIDDLFADAANLFRPSRRRKSPRRRSRTTTIGG